MILMSLDEAHTHMVMSVEEGDSYGLWKLLVNHFERTTTASKARTRRMLHTLRMDVGEEFEMYKAKIMELKMRLESMKEVVTNGELIYVILEGLPKSYATIKQTLEVKDDATFEQICNYIRDYQEKEKYAGTQEKEEYESANYAGTGSYNRAIRDARNQAISDREKLATYRRTMGRERERNNERERQREWPCSVCDKYGHDTYDCELRKDRRAGDCFRCGKSEHHVKDCPERGRSRGANRNESAWSAIEVEDEPECAF